MKIILTKKEIDASDNMTVTLMKIAEPSFKTDGLKTSWQQLVSLSESSSLKNIKIKTTEEVVEIELNEAAVVATYELYESTFSVILSTMLSFFKGAMSLFEGFVKGKIMGDGGFVFQLNKIWGEEEKNPNDPFKDLNEKSNPFYEHNLQTFEWLMQETDISESQPPSAQAQAEVKKILDPEFANKDSELNRLADAAIDASKHAIESRNSELPNVATWIRTQDVFHNPKELLKAKYFETDIGLEENNKVSVNGDNTVVQQSTGNDGVQTTVVSGSGNTVIQRSGGSRGNVTFI